MNRIARLIGISLCLLAIFLATVFASWLRLRHHTEILRQAAIETRKHQLDRALALTHPGALPWTETYLKDLGAMVDAQIAIVGQKTPAEDQPEAGAWHFEYPWSNDAGKVGATLDVNFSPPPSARLGSLYRHTALVLLVVALGLLTILIIILIFNLNSQQETADKVSGRGGSGKEFDSLTRLARMSVSQHAELEHERTERQRADEDIHYQQMLLNRALEEKIQLGRELHDGVIQSLYATGLTLEAAKKHISASPGEAVAQLETGLKTLNTTIREIRSYINGLAPEKIQQQNFAKAVQSLAQTLGSSRNANFDIRIDETAVAQLSDESVTHLIQIIREALSNSLRHGGATQLTVRLHENANEVGLLVQDNGRGFDPSCASRGHGLDNIKARAERINADLRITSAVGEGTRIVVTLPIASRIR